MNHKQRRPCYKAWWKLVFVAWSVVTLMAIIPGRAAAGPFVGSPPLPAHESAWVLIDGDEQPTGTTTTLDVAERLATKVLQLQQGKSLFRFSPKTHDLASVEKSFGRSGTVGKTLAEVSPAVVVLMIEGKSLPTGAGYGTSNISSPWIDKRIEDIYAVCPSALVVVVAEPMAAGTREKLFAAAAKRQKALAQKEKQSAPLFLLLGVPGSGSTTAGAVQSSLMAAIERADPAVASLKGEMAKVFTGGSGDSLGIVGALFVTAILGAANDDDANGYDIVKIDRWISARYPKVVEGLSSPGSRPGDFTSGAHWGDDDESIAPTYPLKRRRYTIGVCVAAVTSLPGRPGESDSERTARTRIDLGELASALEKGARDALRETPGALAVEVLDPSKLPPPVPASGPAACASTKARNRYDAWVELVHKESGHYRFQIARVRIRETVKSNPEPLPDRDQTRELLAAAGQELMRPIAVYKPVSEKEIVAVASASPPPSAPEQPEKALVAVPPGFAQAQLLLQQGKDAFDRGDARQALKLYRGSHEAYPTTEALYSAAECEDRLGLKDDARRDRETLVGQFPADNVYVIAARQRLTVAVEGKTDGTVKPPPSRPLRTVGFVTGGVGLAGLAAGGATGILALVKRNQVASLCPVAKECTVEGVQVANAARTFAAASTVAWIAGAALTSAGVVLVAAARDRKRGGATKVDVRVDGVGATVEGTF